VPPQRSPQPGGEVRVYCRPVHFCERLLEPPVALRPNAQPCRRLILMESKALCAPAHCLQSEGLCCAGEQEKSKCNCRQDLHEADHWSYMHTVALQ